MHPANPQLTEHHTHPQRPDHPAHPNSGPNSGANDGYRYGRPARPAAATLPPLPTIIFPSVPKGKTVAPVPAATSTVLAPNPKFVPAATAAASPTAPAPKPKFVAPAPAALATTTSTPGKAQVQAGAVQVQYSTTPIQSQPRGQRLVHDADPVASAAETSAVAATQVSTTGPAQLAVAAGVLVAAEVGAVVLVQRRRRRRFERGIPVATTIRP
ncbi:hypothetical protein GGF31_007476 [Allomyces arbusculus]|nr:hypothetical protein GGF31_007476 [Allomyces arbusculus]